MKICLIRKFCPILVNSQPGVGPCDEEGCCELPNLCNRNQPLVLQKAASSLVPCRCTNPCIVFVSVLFNSWAEPYATKTSTNLIEYRPLSIRGRKVISYLVTTDFWKRKFTSLTNKRFCKNRNTKTEELIFAAIFTVEKETLHTDRTELLQ